VTIHVRRAGSTWSWVWMALMVVFVVVVLATGYFGLK
jgi:hypothetical protein